MQLAEDEFERRGIDFAVLHPTAMGRGMYEHMGWVPTGELAKSLK